MGADGHEVSVSATVGDGPGSGTPVAAGVQAGVQAGVASVLLGLSGLYRQAAPGRAELRLDVDGPQPQMAMSGLIIGGLTHRAHWIAEAKLIGPGQYRGDIWFKDGAVALAPHQTASVTLDTGSQPRKATVVFSGGGAPTATMTFFQKSDAFRPVEFEYDTVEGATATTEIDTWAHPNRPSGVARENLSIETVFRRAGFDVIRSSGDQVLPLKLTGADAVWSDSEMHDAMQTYWSRFADSPQWSLWVLFAALHESGESLGGIMFDDIGPNHRQGTAIFSDSFIARPPEGDGAAAAWVARMRFWTACHEMGHAFNLAHAWQKTLQSRSWIPMRDEPQGRSFMNYPFKVTGGQTAFFSDFAYRFSDQELLFMRHAPERFVQMGGAKWFDDHGFRQAEESPEPRLNLVLRVNRPQPIFEFLEPCVVELKLANIGDEPILVRENALRDAERLVVIIRKQGQEAREWLPYAHYCSKSPKTVLAAGAAVYDTLFIAAGRNGWDLAEPGRYCIQVLARIDGEDVVSNPLNITVRPPRSYEEEVVAQDFFSDEVGRVLAFDGSRVLDQANAVLEDAAARLPDRAVARHAQIAMGKALIGGGKVLVLPPTLQATLESAKALGGAVKGASQVEAGVKMLNGALLSQPVAAAETLSHIDFRDYSDDLSNALAKVGESKTAAKVQGALHDALSTRKVAPWVLEDIRARQQGFLDGGDRPSVETRGRAARRGGKGKKSQ